MGCCAVDRHAAETNVENENKLDKGADLLKEKRRQAREGGVANVDEAILTELPTKKEKSTFSPRTSGDSFQQWEGQFPFFHYYVMDFFEQV
jgi:hypothetical protein